MALSRERILDAALALLDRDGLEALSMRKLGEALGVEAMSLYNHVPNKAALLDGIHELILTSVPAPPATRPAATTASFARLEHYLQVLRAAGFSALDAQRTVHVVLSYVVGHAMW